MSRLNFLIFCLGIIFLSIAYFIYIGSEGYDLDKEMLNEYISSLSIQSNDFNRLEKEIDKLFITGRFIDFIGRSYYIFIFTFVLGISFIFYVLHIYVDYYVFIKGKYGTMRSFLALRRSFYLCLLTILYFINRVYFLPNEFNVGFFLILLTIEVFFLTLKTDYKNNVDDII